MSPSTAISNQSSVGWLLLLVFVIPSTTFGLENLSQYVFVSNAQSQNIAIIDTVSDDLVQTVKLPQRPAQVILSEEQRKLVITSPQEKRLHILSLDSIELEDTIELGFDPVHLRLGAAGSVVAIGNPLEGTIALVELGDNRETHRITGLDHPAFFTFGRDGEYLFVADGYARHISVIDVTEGTIVKTIPLRSATAISSVRQPIEGFARTPGGMFGFVMQGNDGLMSVLDLRGQKLLQTVDLGGPAHRAYPSANSQYLFVPDSQNRSLSLISTWKFEEAARLTGASDIRIVTTALFDSLAFAVSYGENKVLVFDVDEHRLLKEVHLDSNPTDAVVSADGLKIYVGLPHADKVAVIDAITLRINKFIESPEVTPHDLAMVRDLAYCH